MIWKIEILQLQYNWMLIGMLLMVYLINKNVCAIYNREFLFYWYSLEDVYEIKNVAKFECLKGIIKHEVLL